MSDFRIHIKGTYNGTYMTYKTVACTERSFVLLQAIYFLIIKIT